MISPPEARELLKITRDLVYGLTTEEYIEIITTYSKAVDRMVKEKEKK